MVCVMGRWGARSLRSLRSYAPGGLSVSFLLSVSVLHCYYTLYHSVSLWLVSIVLSLYTLQILRWVMLIVLRPRSYGTRDYVLFASPLSGLWPVARHLRIAKLSLLIT